MFEAIDLGAMPWRAQMMLLAGISLMIWVLFRRNIRARRNRRRQDAELRVERKKWAARATSGAPLADAPADVARWQSGMFDLHRELRADLDTKIAVVQSMVRLADQRIETLRNLNEERLETTIAGRADRVESLTRLGRSTQEIAETLRISIGDVEFLQSLAHRNV
jgi:hypothetical protein